MEFENRIRRILDHAFKGYYLENYILKDGKTHPFAIICPGGGYWRVCSFVEGLPFARKLNAMGYSAIVVHYRCGSKYPYPVPQEDLARAIRHVLQHKDRWKLDMEGYSLWGASAGGHLAASFGTDAMGYKRYGLPKPGALILSYPVVTMGEKAHEGSRKHLLGEDRTPHMIQFASIEKQITADYPPTFLWCGLEDRSVDPDNSRMLAEALKEWEIPHAFLTVADVGHGVGIGEGLACEGWFEKAVGFWESCRK